MSEIAQENVILKMHLFILDERKADFIEWQTKLNAVIATAVGFVSLEILSPIKTTQPEWVIVQRFATYAHMASRKDSNTYHQLLDEVKPLLVKDHILEEVETDISHLQGGVTEVIITEVNPQKEYVIVVNIYM